MKLTLTGAGFILCLSACTTTKEQTPNLILPTTTDIEATERANWDSRLNYLKRMKVIDEAATGVELARVASLECWAMFNSWAECKYDLELIEDGKPLLAKKIFGQFDPQPDGRWDSVIIMWHERRK